MGQPTLRAKIPAAAFIRCGLRRKTAECPGSSSLRYHPHAIVKIQMKVQNPTRVLRRRCPKPKWVHAPAKLQKTRGSMQHITRIHYSRHNAPMEDKLCVLFKAAVGWQLLACNQPGTGITPGITGITAPPPITLLNIAFPAAAIAGVPATRSP